jgi:putative transposase
MKRKRFTDEQIAFALRQAEAGTSVEEFCRKLGNSEPTFYRWKKQFAGMGVAEIRRLKQLEENKRLKVQSAALHGRRPHPRQDHAAGRRAPKMVTPSRRRSVVEHLRSAYQVSERRACRATGFHRSSQRYRTRRDP